MRFILNNENFIVTLSLKLSMCLYFTKYVHVIIPGLLKKWGTIKYL